MLLTILEKTLKDAGYSVTHARKEVFKTLLTHQPLTIRELSVLLMPNTDRASVYRTVNLFEKIGVVKKVYTGWKYKIELSELFNPHHHHLHCTKCQKIISFEEPPEIDKILHALEEKYSFTVSSHQFELQGLCKNCQS